MCIRDRHSVRLSHLLNQTHAIPIRQAEIQNDEVRMMGSIHHHAERTGLRAENLIVAGFQICFNEASDVGFILYDQDLKFCLLYTSAG